MPRKVKTRRQRKAANVKKNVAKGEQTNHPGNKLGNMENRVNIDENLAQHMTLKSPSVKEELPVTSSNEFVKKKAAWELGNALDKYEEQNSSSDSVGTIDEDELLDQIWKDLDDIFPSNDKAVAEGGMSPNVDWVNPSINLESSDNLVKKPAQHRGESSKGTHNAWEVGDVLDNDKKQYSSKLEDNFDLTELNQMIKDVDAILFDEAAAKGGFFPSVEVRKQCDSLIKIIINGNRPPPLATLTEQEAEATIASIEEFVKKRDQRDGIPPRNAWELGNALDKYEDEYSTQHINQPPLVSSSEEEKDETIKYSPQFIQKKAAHQRTGTPEGTRDAWKLGNALDKDEEQYSSSDALGIMDETELHQIWQELNKIFVLSDESDAKGGLTPTCGADSGPVSPKFFGDSGYFMLTGTNSQLQQQLKDLEARNIFVESFVELSHATADIVEQQMTDLVKNRDPILGMMPDKYDLLEPRRVQRQKKQRKKTYE